MTPMYTKMLGRGKAANIFSLYPTTLHKKKTANGVTTNLADFVNKLLVNKLEDSKNIYLFEKQTGISSSEWFCVELLHE